MLGSVNQNCKVIYYVYYLYTKKNDYWQDTAFKRLCLSIVMAAAVALSLIFSLSPENTNFFTLILPST